jgi:endonuclease YncB( thermonuclease family)
MSAPAPSYAYKASYLSNADGDTIRLRVDRGQITHGVLDDPTWTVRLYGIDTWERTGKDKVKGLAARAFTEATLKGARRIVVQTIHPDLRPPEMEKYGRVLCRVWVDGELLSDLLRAAGHEKQIGSIV